MECVTSSSVPQTNSAAEVLISAIGPLTYASIAGSDIRVNQTETAANAIQSVCATLVR